MSTSSVEPCEKRLFILFKNAVAVSIEVRHGTLLYTALRLILTLSREGILPFDDVEITYAAFPLSIRLIALFSDSWILSTTLTSMPIFSIIFAVPFVA